jgi:DNA-binding MarR family transcriptional regulator
VLELDRFLPYLVNKLGARLSNELAAVYQARFGITIPEWRVIAHLAAHKNVSVREIFARVAMDKSKVSRAAARLEALGLVEKQVNGADRRLVALQLTAKGRALFGQIEPLALDYERAALGCLSAAEAELLRGLVGRLLAAGTAGHDRT